MKWYHFIPIIGTIIQFIQTDDTFELIDIAIIKAFYDAIVLCLITLPFIF